MNLGGGGERVESAFWGDCSIAGWQGAVRAGSFLGARAAGDPRVRREAGGTGAAGAETGSRAVGRAGGALGGVQEQ